MARYANEARPSGDQTSLRVTLWVRVEQSPHSLSESLSRSFQLVGLWGWGIHGNRISQSYLWGWCGMWTRIWNTRIVVEEPISQCGWPLSYIWNNDPEDSACHAFRILWQHLSAYAPLPSFWQLAPAAVLYRPHTGQITITERCRLRSINDSNP